MYITHAHVGLYTENSMVDANDPDDTQKHNVRGIQGSSTHSSGGLQNSNVQGRQQQQQQQQKPAKVNALNVQRMLEPHQKPGDSTSSMMDNQRQYLGTTVSANNNADYQDNMSASTPRHPGGHPGSPGQPRPRDIEMYSTKI